MMPDVTDRSCLVCRNPWFEVVSESVLRCSCEFPILFTKAVRGTRRERSIVHAAQLKLHLALLFHVEEPF